MRELLKAVLINLVAACLATILLAIVATVINVCGERLVLEVVSRLAATLPWSVVVIAIIAIASIAVVIWGRGRRWPKINGPAEITYLTAFISELEGECVQVYAPLSGVVKATREASPFKRAGRLFPEQVYAALRQPGEQLDEKRKESGIDQQVDLQDVVRRYKKVAVLGEPGAGKTTFLKQLALHYARLARTGQRVPIPVFVDLSQYDPKEDMLAFIKRQVAPSPGRAPQAFADNLENYMRSGRVLVLLDGLNEMPSSSQQPLAELINPMTGFPTCQYVVACRAQDYDPMSELTSVVIQPLDWQGAQSFIRKSVSNQNTASDLIAAIEEGRMEGLVANPQLLYMVTDIYQHTRMLPRDRSGVMAGFVDKLLLRDDKSVSVATRKQKGVYYPRHNDVDTILSDLAYRMTCLHRTKLTTNVACQVVQTALARRGLPGKPEKLLKVAQNATLLRSVGQDYIGFRHPVLQEYFAALTLQERLGAEISLDKLADDWWWEETLAALSALSPIHSERLLQGLLALVDQKMLTVNLASATPEQRAGFLTAANRLLVAARCAAASTLPLDCNARESISAVLKPLASVPGPLKEDVWEVIGRVSRSGAEALLLEVKERLEVKGRHHIGSYEYGQLLERLAESLRLGVCCESSALDAFMKVCLSDEKFATDAAARALKRFATPKVSKQVETFILTNPKRASIHQHLIETLIDMDPGLGKATQIRILKDAHNYPEALLLWLRVLEPAIRLLVYPILRLPIVFCVSFFFGWFALWSTTVIIELRRLPPDKIRESLQIMQMMQMIQKRSLVALGIIVIVILAYYAIRIIFRKLWHGLWNYSERKFGILSKIATVDNEYLKAWALTSLTFNRDQEVGKFLPYTHDTRAVVRTQAVRGLAQIRRQGAEATLIEVFRRESDPRIKRFIMRSLRNSGTVFSARHFALQLTSKNPETGLSLDHPPHDYFREDPVHSILGNLQLLGCGGSIDWILWSIIAREGDEECLKLLIKAWTTQEGPAFRSLWYAIRRIRCRLSRQPDTISISDTGCCLTG